MLIRYESFEFNYLFKLVSFVYMKNFLVLKFYIDICSLYNFNIVEVDLELSSFFRCEFYATMMRIEKFNERL